MKLKHFPKPIIFSALFIFFAYTASAQSVLPASQGQGPKDGTGTGGSGPQLKMGALSKRCELVEQRVNAKLERYRSNENRYQGTYIGLGNKLENLLSRLREDYGDTDEFKALEGDLEQLNTLKTKLQESVGEYHVRLEATRTFACEESEGQFSAALKNAQDQVTTSREVVKEIKDLYLNEIKPDIAALKVIILADRQETEQDETE